jgi:hypothetical protein
MSGLLLKRVALATQNFIHKAAIYKRGFLKKVLLFAIQRNTHLNLGWLGWLFLFPCCNESVHG